MSLILQSRLVRVALILAALGVLGWLMPFAPLKFMVALASVAILALSVKTYTRRVAGLIVLSIVIFLVPMTVNLYSRVILDALENLNIWPYVSIGAEREPNMTLMLQSNVSITIDGNVEVTLVEGRSVELPDELKVRTIGDRLEVSGGERSRKYVLRIGTDGLETLFIAASSIWLKGEGSMDELQIEATAIDVRANVRSKKLFISGTGINVDSILSGESLRIDGTGLNLKGSLSFDQIKIDGTGISMKLELNDCGQVFIVGTGINGEVKVAGTRDTRLVLSGTGGTVKVRNMIGDRLSVQSSNVKVTSEW
ncbi:MAG: hypothetical protein ACPLTP_05785 [Thermotoga caldifontis]|uniref:hypothetical protein n=1 Tax=Thermotoga caldifontis TaxID=1508419 RepID=UPI003C7ACF5E